VFGNRRAYSLGDSARGSHRELQVNRLLVATEALEHLATLSRNQHSFAQRLVGWHFHDAEHNWARVISSGERTGQVNQRSTWSARHNRGDNRQ
jgi:hypothetical protein